MTTALVAVNAAVYLLWHTIGRSPAGLRWLASSFLLSTGSIAQGRLWTPLLAEFSHIDTTHLVFNMVGLWTFGRAVERAIGSWRLLQLYVAGALFASVGYLVYAAVVHSRAPSLGASGAVSAIAVVFACLYPRAWLVVNFIIPVPAMLAVVLFLILDVVGVLNPQRDMVAHAAHLGGALFGLVYWTFWVRPRRRLAYEA